MVKSLRHSSALVVLVGGGLLFIPACYPTDPFPIPQSSFLEINKSGAFVSEELGIQGQWYVYGDTYGKPQSCFDVGQRDESVCSTVTYPEVHLPEVDFPNSGGRMCISGVVSKLLPCCTEQAFAAGLYQCVGVNEINCLEDGELDHSSMWGAGMGFDLDLQLKKGGIRDYEAIHARTPWNAADHRVIGIAFELEWHNAGQAPPLRVEFPMQINESIQLPKNQGTVRLTASGELDPLKPDSVLPAGASSEEHPYGSPFWQLPGETDWKRSPIVEGTNTILWEDVFPPPPTERNYLDRSAFAGEQLLGIQFHVIPDKEGAVATPFSFCISDFRFLTE